MIRLAMVGGGQGAFIGAVHRMAARLDGRAVLCAGALSSSPERAVQSARELGLPADRSYPSWQALISGELKRPAEDRAQAIVIVTPNASHFEIAMSCVEAGFHVVCDKPMVVTDEQARTLVRAATANGVVFGVTYNYAGYPLVRAARELISRGELGAIRRVAVEYHQGWLATRLESSGQKQASWRTDPSSAGAGGAVGDIGSHAENLVQYVTGLEVEELCADLKSFVDGRTLDDDASVLLRFVGGARGTLTCSQVCIGEENNLTLRVYGEKASISWRQENPNELLLCKADGSRQVLTRACAEAGPLSAAATRLPPGHPEGFIEAFANVYRGVFDAIDAHAQGRPWSAGAGFAGAEDGARGVRFVNACVESSRRGGIWLPFESRSGV